MSILLVDGYGPTGGKGSLVGFRGFGDFGSHVLFAFALLLLGVDTVNGNTPGEESLLQIRRDLLRHLPRALQVNAAAKAPEVLGPLGRRREKKARTRDTPKMSLVSNQPQAVVFLGEAHAPLKAVLSARKPTSQPKFSLIDPVTMFRTSSTATSPLLVLLTLTATSTLVVASRNDGDTNPRDSVRLVHALCGNPSWTLVDTYVALPMLRDDALKASRYPILQRFSPVEGNLSVRSQASLLELERASFYFTFVLSTHSLSTLFGFV